MYEMIEYLKKCSTGILKPKSAILGKKFKVSKVLKEVIKKEAMF